MRMSRVNVYLPADLADDARAAGLNVSALTQVAVRDALAARKTDTWLDGLLEIKGRPVDVHQLMSAVRDARDELERGRE